jgi:hypothetical protein
MPLHTHETMATNARKRLNTLIGRDVHGSQRPAQTVAVILEALYYHGRSLHEHEGDDGRLKAARIYEELTGEKPGWLDKPI